MSYNDFVDLKSLTDEVGFNCKNNSKGEQIKLSDIKMIKCMQGSKVCY